MCPAATISSSNMHFCFLKSCSCSIVFLAQHILSQGTCHCNGGALHLSTVLSQLKPLSFPLATLKEIQGLKTIIQWIAFQLNRSFTSKSNIRINFRETHWMNCAIFHSPIAHLRLFCTWSQIYSFPDKGIRSKCSMTCSIVKCKEDFGCGVLCLKDWNCTISHLFENIFTSPPPIIILASMHNNTRLLWDAGMLELLQITQW